MAEPIIDAAAPKDAPAPTPPPKPEPVVVAKAEAPTQPAPKPEPANDNKLADAAVLEEIKRERAELAVELARARDQNERTRNRALLSTLKQWGAMDIGDAHLLALAPKAIDPETPQGLAELDKWAKGEGARLFAQKAPTTEAVLAKATERLKAPDSYKGPHDSAYAANLLNAVATRIGNRGGR
jgi:hypothetical protein